MLPADDVFSRKLLVCVHNGALGDFLNVLPALYAIKKTCPDKYLYWSGKKAHAHWAGAAGIKVAPPSLRRAAERLYGATALPEALRDAGVLWFGLGAAPTPHPVQGLVFLPGVNDSFTPPRELYRRVLAARGLAWDEAWQAHFRAHWGGWSQAEQKRPDGEVLLFPGGGHRAKHWPLVKYFELYDRLARQGVASRFVLGSAELERGPRPEDLGGRACLVPADLAELQAALTGCRAVCGNDCGPLHLAGLVGAPGVVLFGPTSARQWRPLGLGALSADTACRPCTRTTARIACAPPAAHPARPAEATACMAAIGVEDVLAELLKTLEA